MQKPIADFASSQCDTLAVTLDPCDFGGFYLELSKARANLSIKIAVPRRNASRVPRMQINICLYISTDRVPQSAPLISFPQETSYHRALSGPIDRDAQSLNSLRMLSRSREVRDLLPRAHGCTPSPSSFTPTCRQSYTTNETSMELFRT